MKLVEYEQQTKSLMKMATDIINVPIVLEGYQLSGRPGNTVFMNVDAMAWSRVIKHFPMAQKNDSLFERVRAEFRKIAAECVLKKYQMRQARISYNHIKECDEACKRWIYDNIENQREIVKLLEV
jgi:hypothetical protein